MLPTIAMHLEGWTLHVEPSLVREHRSLWNETQDELRRQLMGIERVVPDGPLAKLRQVPIWVHLSSPETKCMAFHPAADWLAEHHMDPAMARSVEIGNATNFVSWTYEQPWMVLHELAHAYQFRFLPNGFDNEDVKKAYDAAIASKRYESVRHWDGAMVKAYATTNPMEYFAETTEAYFGTNDFFPFVRGELVAFEPDGYTLMTKLWGPPSKRVPE